VKGARALHADYLIIVVAQLAFFTTKKVEAFEELTWDYGIDFDDVDGPCKAFRCMCGSRYCRDPRSTRRMDRAAGRN